MRTGTIIAIGALTAWVWVTSLTNDLQAMKCEAQLAEAVAVAYSEYGTDTDIERAERLMKECN